MSFIPEEIVSKLGEIQNQICQKMTVVASEAAMSELNFSSPLTVAASTSDLYGELSAARLIIQFSLADMPENALVILLPTELFGEVAALVKEEKVDNIDENLISDARPVLEALVQAYCMAIGEVRNEALVASGMSIRYQVFSFPPNMQRETQLIRTNIVTSGSDVNGTITILVDRETAYALLGMEVPADDEPTLSVSTGGAASSSSGISEQGIDDQGLEILMDIPLEVSVELGRVKMLVRDVVELGAGAIVEIDKAAGEPVDVLVNGRLVARGEVVVIEDNFGVRITEILSLQDRLAKLNEVA